MEYYTFDQVGAMTEFIKNKEEEEKEEEDDKEEQERILALVKYAETQEASKIGKYWKTFEVNYDNIPHDLKEKLDAKDLAKLVDAFYDNYQKGIINGMKQMYENPGESKIWIGVKDK